MSEPMSMDDIEDVLSSIRRLVSEDMLPVGSRNIPPKEPALKAATATQATFKHSVTHADGKLLLTPALRVVAVQADVKTEAEDAPEAPYAFVEVDQAPEPALLLKIRSTPKEASFEDEGASVSTQSTDEDWLPENSDAAEALSGEGAEEVVVREQPTSDVTRVVSEIAAGVSAADEDWESETGDGPDISWQAPEWADEAEVVEADPLTEDAAKEIADKAEAAAVAEIMASTADVTPESASADSTMDGDELRFDEEVLRDLVRDLIHQELSGPLGERITRNVRKLVRSEINRVRTASSIE